MDRKIAEFGKNEDLEYRLFKDMREAREYAREHNEDFCSGLDGSPTEKIFKGVLKAFGYDDITEIETFIYPGMSIKPLGKLKAHIEEYERTHKEE